MRNIHKIAFVSILICLFVAIPASFAMDNQTVIGIDDDNRNDIMESVGEEVLGNDYYFDASVENDTGNGSIDNPYKNLNSERIPDNSVIHLANGEYSLDNPIGSDSVTIMGQNVENTIIKFNEFGISTKKSLTLINVTLVNCGISGSSNSEINANNVIFKDSKSGSIISSSSSLTINLDNCTFMNNTNEYGGAIKIENGILNINNCLFINNHARLYGGVISSDGNAKINIKKSKFINDCSLNDAGGAIYIRTSSNFICVDSQFINCTSTFGGAITVLNTTSSLINITARDNKAKYDGGVVYSMYGSMSVINSTFSDNSAKNGGALFVDSVSKFEIRNNSFTSNNATHTAGAVYNIFNNMSVLKEEFNNTFSNNVAGFENDAYESEMINMTIGSNDFILIKYNSTFDGEIPSNYDLRNAYVTPVKNQGSNGNCWAFAALASLESCILKATGTTYDLSEANMKNLMSIFSDYGWDMMTNVGGYDKMGYGYLVSWLGPINESDDEYNIGTVLSPVLNSIFHVQNVLFLERKNYTDNDAIKKAIMEYGAVATSIYWSSSYVSGKNVYCADSSTGANHAVTIVGWDDNYLKNNFISTPPGDGAWIIKNSWGNSSGDKGFYYVSYYDVSCAKPNKLESNIVFVFNDSIKYDKNYQYDIAGKTDYLYNSSSTVWYKNIFNATDNEYLTAVSTYFSKKTDWELFIYVNNELKHTQSGSSPNSYSTIELNEYIPLTKGDKFEVVFKITVDGDAGVPISESVSLNHQVYSEGFSFISQDGIKWADLCNFEWTYPNHSYNSQVACIKAFTILNPVGTTINLTVDNNDNPCMIRAIVLNEYGNPVMSGNVNLTVENQSYVVGIVDGAATLCHVFNSFGSKQIVAHFEKTGFISSDSEINVEIAKGNVEITLDINVDLLDAQISITLSRPINETVLIVVNQSSHEVNVIDGVGKLALDDLYYGKYDVEASIDTELYDCENVTDSFNINYLKTFIEASDVENCRDVDFTYSIRLVDRNNDPIEGKSIIFSIGDETKEATTNEEGIASVNLKLDVGRYTIHVTCPEEGKYFKSEISKNILIKSTISVPSVSVYTYNSNYIVDLVDVDGNKLANAEVTLIIGSNTYILHTDSNGRLSYNVNLTPGSYNFTVKNLNTSEVKTQTINVVKRITENKAVKMYYGAGSSYKVLVLDDNGNVAKSVKVKFTINGKTYYRNTDSNGYASLKISLKPNKYTVTAEYKGYKVSNKVTVKPTIITKDKTVKKGKTIKFKAKLINSKGKVLKNKKIKFKFKGKKYKVKTNKKGIAKLKITKRYKAGTYVISSKYGDLKVKNKITIK